MITCKIFISTVLAAGLLTGCSDNAKYNADITEKNSNRNEASEPAVTRSKIDRVVERHTLTFMRQQPVQSTILDIDPGRVGGKYNNRLPDYSLAGMQKIQADMRQAAAELSAIDQSGFGPADRLHLNVVEVIEQYYAGSSDFSAGFIDVWGGHLPYIANQVSGPLINIPDTMQTQQRIASLEDAQDYLDRLAAFELLAEQVLNKLKADEEAGVVLPRKLFPKTLVFFQKFLSPAADQHPLVTTFADRLAKIDGIGADEKERLLAAAVLSVEKTVYPGYQKIYSFMQGQEKRAHDDDGIWAQPGGEDFYRHEIHFLSDSTLSAEEIHAKGLAEVERISAEMDRILKANGKTEGTVAERMIALNADPQFLYEDSDKGRQQLLSDLNQQVEAVMAKAPEIFATLPSAQVEVRRIPQVSEASSPGGYYTSPSLDGSRPGIYWINLKSVEANPSFSLKTLTYHEAVPGHHFQIALNMAQTDIGLLRQNAPFNAFTEGWALYSELLAKEMGMYVDDPWGDLGRLQAELFRAVRLVVDTGLHAKHWTREQAIDYFYNTTGNAKSGVISEVERYMAWPGQALGYKLGMLQFVELRQWAHEQLGDRFDLRGFHDQILLPGARPMAQVKRDIETWASQQK